jgi:hypothetical protein
MLSNEQDSHTGEATGDAVQSDRQLRNAESPCIARCNTNQSIEADLTSSSREPGSWLWSRQTHSFGEFFMREHEALLTISQVNAPCSVVWSQRIGQLHMVLEMWTSKRHFYSIPTNPTSQEESRDIV